MTATTTTDDTTPTAAKDLVVDGVDVAYGRTQVLFDVSLSVPGGSLVCLMGRNGVGKTTLLNTIGGLLSPTRGAIRFGDADITARPAHQRARAAGGPQCD